MRVDGSFFRLVEDTLAFEYQSGDVTTMHRPFSTGWRALPCLLTAQLQGGQAVLEMAGRAPLTIADGSLLCLAPGVRHCLVLQTLTGVSRWSHVNFTLLGGLDVSSLLELPLCFTGKTAERIGELNGELAGLARPHTATLEHAVRRKSLGLLLLLQLFDAAQLRDRGDRVSTAALLLPQHQRLAAVFGYIADNISRRMSMGELARLAHLSPSRFHAVFRATTGQAPRDYVLRLRLRKAQELLITTDLAVKEIALRIGMADPFFFSRIFSRKCGVSPSEYRRCAQLTSL